jgi:hypothetical protein
MYHILWDWEIYYRIHKQPVTGNCPEARECITHHAAVLTDGEGETEVVPGT